MCLCFSNRIYEELDKNSNNNLALKQKFVCELLDRERHICLLSLCSYFFPFFFFVFLFLSQCLYVSLLFPSSSASFSAIVLKKLGCRGSEMNKNVILTVPIVCSHLFLLYRFISGGKLLAGREDASQNDIYFIVQGGSPACFHVTQILEL